MSELAELTDNRQVKLDLNLAIVLWFGRVKAPRKTYADGYLQVSEGLVLCSVVVRVYWSAVRDSRKLHDPQLPSLGNQLPSLSDCCTIKFSAIACGGLQSSFVGSWHTERQFCDPIISQCPSSLVHCTASCKCFVSIIACTLHCANPESLSRPLPLLFALISFATTPFAPIDMLLIRLLSSSSLSMEPLLVGRGPCSSKMASKVSQPRSRTEEISTTQEMPQTK